MIRIYCRGDHRSSGILCPECREFSEYAQARLDRCPFQQNKSTCANCAVHCYKSAMRDRARVVMKYAGPKMAYRHPVLALHHLLDGRREAT